MAKGYVLPVIIALDLNVHQVESFLKVLKRFKRAIWWTIADNIGIPPGICSHKIQLMPDHKPSIEHQRRLNPPMQGVVKKETIKWWDDLYLYRSCADGLIRRCVPKVEMLSVLEAC